MREYIREWSPALGRDMEVLRFGTAGRPLLAFPTSMGRFYQWEDFGLVSALEDRIEGGSVQVWCVDAVDGESW
ncbi:MAG: esterase, partial [Actinobacteria bacterium]|nr:esterase [Actinomycetota bacterium]